MTSKNLAATLDQDRARNAWDIIQGAKDLDEKKKDAFGVQLKKLPMRILAAGLGQSLAFLEAKDKDSLLLDALAKWINTRRKVEANGRIRLVERIIKGDADFLRFATAECLAYLQWLVRFADAEGITKDEKPGTPGG